MIASLKIVAVIRGSVQPEGEKWDPVDDEHRDDMSEKSKLLSIPPPHNYQRDPYALPREMGILHVVPSENDLTGILHFSSFLLCSLLLSLSLSSHSSFFSSNNCGQNSSTKRTTQTEVSSSHSRSCHCSDDVVLVRFAKKKVQEEEYYEKKYTPTLESVASTTGGGAASNPTTPTAAAAPEPTSPEKCKQ